MKKFYFFLITALLLIHTVDIKGQGTTVIINQNNGKLLKNGTQENQTWNNTWISNVSNPQIKLTSNANNISRNGKEMLDLRSGQSQSSTYTLTVNGNYHIKNYTIIGKALTNSQTITPANMESTTFNNTTEKSLTVTVDDNTARFVLSGDNTGLAATINVSIEPYVRPTNEYIRPQDVNIVQAYQTTGQGNNAPILKINITPSNEDVNIKSLNLQLKGHSKDLISSINVFTTNGDEFFADEKPTKIGAITALNKNEISIPIDYQLRGGVNKLWVTMMVKDDAEIGEQLDAQLLSLTYSHNQDVETTVDVSSKGNPEGYAKIFKTQSFPYVPTTYNCRYYRIPGIIIANDGSVIVSSDKRYNSDGDLGNHKIDVVVRRSSDNGKTWAEPNIIAVGDGHSPEAYGYGDAALAKAPNGDLIAVMCAGKNSVWSGQTNIGITTSKDNGLSWSKVREMTTNNFTDEIGNTKNHFSEFSNFITSGRGITTKEGEIMFLGNVLYKQGDSFHNHIFRSNDNGESWTLSKESVYDGGDEAKLAQRPDGTIMASIRQSGARGFNFGNTSGRIWNGQYRSTTLAGNACNADIITYNDRLMLHTILVNQSQRKDLRLFASVNNGETWHEVFTIQEGSTAYSCMEILNNGDLAIVFEDGSYGNNGYTTSYVTLPKEMIEKFENNIWNDKITPYSQYIDNLKPWITDTSDQYFTLTKEAKDSLKPLFETASKKATADNYFDFLASFRQAMTSQKRIPETGYYRIKSTRARSLLTYITFGASTNNNRTGLLTIPESEGKSNIGSVFKLTRLANGKYTLSTQGLNVQGKPNANELFQCTNDNGQEFTIVPLENKPGVVGITTGETGGYLNETSWTRNGYNGVTCWNINDPASQWTIEDSDEIELPLTTMGEHSYATAFMPFPFSALDSKMVTVIKDKANNLAVETLVTDTLPPLTPIMLIGNKNQRSTILNIGKEPTHNFNLPNDLRGTLLQRQDLKAFVLGTLNGKYGYWNLPFFNDVKANSAYLDMEEGNKIQGYELKNISSKINTLTQEKNDKKIYDLQGRQLKEAQSGINIINGQKVLYK